MYKNIQLILFSMVFQLKNIRDFQCLFSTCSLTTIVDILTTACDLIKRKLFSVYSIYLLRVFLFLIPVACPDTTTTFADTCRRCVSTYYSCATGTATLTNVCTDPGEVWTQAIGSCASPAVCNALEPPLP